MTQHQLHCLCVPCRRYVRARRGRFMGSLITLLGDGGRYRGNWVCNRHQGEPRVKRLILAASLLAPLPALAASAPQKPDPIVQACAQAATEQMQQAMVFHAQVIADQTRIEALEAQVKRLTPKATPKP